MKKQFVAAASAAVLAAGVLAGCGSNSASTAGTSAAASAQTEAAQDASTQTAAAASTAADTQASAAAPADGDNKITVACSQTPHSEILEQAKAVLEAQGYDLEYTVFEDYVQPNKVVESGDFDANYFQHVNYLNSFNEENGTHLVVATNGKIHYEPFGIYPGSKSSLDELEDQILDGNTEGVLEQIAEIRNDLRDLKIHYTQLIDVCQEFEENENHFFKDENERYFHLVAQRIERLLEMLLTLVDFTIQLRDFCQSKIDEKQNRNLAFLTIISSIFMPLTLIAGWYGMNFKYMPELDKVWAYPLVFVVSVMIVVVCIVFFKKNKWF